jgi:hypothetical protein
MRKRARTDLCGGRSVMVVPTATAIHMREKSQMFDKCWPDREREVPFTSVTVGWRTPIAKGNAIHVAAN